MLGRNLKRVVFVVRAQQEEKGMKTPLFNFVVKNAKKMRKLSHFGLRAEIYKMKSEGNRPIVTSTTSSTPVKSYDEKAEAPVRQGPKQLARVGAALYRKISDRDLILCASI